MCLEVSRCVQRCLDVFRSVQMCSELSRCVQRCLDVFRGV